MVALHQVGHHYFPHSRIERLISMGRLALAGLICLVLLSGSAKIVHARTTTATILLWYLIAVFTLAVLAWRQFPLSRRLQILSHSVEVVVVSILLFLNDGADELFFIYFMFLLLCAMLRWQWRGTLWTALAILACLLALQWHPEGLPHSSFFKGDLFIVNVSYAKAAQ